MVRKAEVTDRIFIDEAEGFILSHALFSPPRTWPPLPPEQPSQAERLQRGAKRMDWDTHMTSDASAAVHASGSAVQAGPPSPRASKGKQRTASTGASGMGDWFEIEQSAAAIAGGSNDTSGHAHSSYDEEDSQERCVICLMALRDRTVVGVCGHEFCFECIGVWANQSRRCPLCSADMAPFLLHDLDNPFYLPPLPTRKFPPLTLTIGPSAAGPSRRVMCNQASDTPEGVDKEEADELDKQVARRREIYQHGLFVKHIPSNSTTRFTSNPSPRQIADTPALLQRATAFLRRELRIWGLADVEYLVTYVLNLLKAIDLRSEPFIRLLKDVLEPENSSNVQGGGAYHHADRRHGSHGPHQYPNAAEHLAHELHSWLRSPFKELWRWDAMAQYDPVPDPSAKSSQANATAPAQAVIPDSRAASPLPAARRSISPSLHSDISRSRSRSRSRSISASSISRSPSRSLSRSPSPQRSPRDPTQRDTFIPTSRPGEKQRRWDEHDTWLDPEYEKEIAAKQAKRDKRREKWEAREKRKMEEMQAREGEKRARYELQQQQYQHQARRDGLPVPVAVPIRAIHGMRAWGPASREAVGVELLPESAQAYQGVALDGMEGGQRREEEAERQSGLAIRGRGSSGQGAEGRKLSLAERLAKAKAEHARHVEAPSAPADERRAARALSDIPVNLPSNPADITVEDLLSTSPTSQEHALEAEHQAQLHSQPHVHPPVVRSVSGLSASAEPFTPTAYLSQTTSTATSNSESILDRIARARQRLRLRLKLETERACLRHNIAESRAHTLRAKLLEAKIARQAGETDVQLRRMDKLERDREVRRRLMVVKMMSAETEGERRARELKEKLARAKKGGVGKVRAEPVLDHRYEGVSVRAYVTSESQPHSPDKVTPIHAQIRTLKPVSKSAEAKSKDEERRKKILRNLLLERKRAKGNAGAGSSTATAASEQAEGTERAKVLVSDSAEADADTVEQQLGAVEEDWELEPDAVV